MAECDNCGLQTWEHFELRDRWGALVALVCRRATFERKRGG